MDMLDMPTDTGTQPNYPNGGMNVLGKFVFLCVAHCVMQVSYSAGLKSNTVELW